MHWLKRDIWKAGITIAGMLFLLLLVVWLPVSAAGANEGVSGLATPVTVQTTPTVDATVTELNKEKLDQEVQQLKYQNEQLKNQNTRDFFVWLPEWLQTNAAILLSTLVIVIGGLVGLFRWLGDRRDAQDKDLKAHAEERFKTAVAALGDERESVQVGGAILLRSFLHKEDKKSYERYYTQVFDLAIAHLRLPRTHNSPEDPNAPLPLTTLRQALIVVFKEAFPLARDRLLKEQGTQFLSQSLDASGIQLDIAYLRRADLEQVRMPHASLRGAELRGANLSRADLWGADLSRVRDLEEVRSLDHTDLRRVIGLTKEQLEACKAKGAIIDEDATANASQSPVSPSPPSQSNDRQPLTAPFAQGSIPTPNTDGSNTVSSQQDLES